MFKTIEALCRVIEECLAVIRDDAKRAELTSRYNAVMGESTFERE